VGMSLGGFHGALFGAVDANVTNVALNVPGSDFVQVLLNSPGFAPQRDAFLGQLAQSGVTPGTPGFDQFLVLARTILDPSDPQNFGLSAVNQGNLPTRKVYIQSIQNDFVVPNPTTDLLVNAAKIG